MFELATLNEFIDLKSRHLDKLYPEEHEWGLKQFGTLFCYDQLHHRKGRCLEVGAGQNRFFDENLPSDIDYWAIDSSGFFDAEKYRHSCSLRKRTTLVDGMMGDFHKDLPTGSFDAVFSVSVLEHVPVARVLDACKDMHRVLKPGGYMVHSLDLTPANYDVVGKEFLKSLREVGFQFFKTPAVDYTCVSQDGLLTEPISLVFKYYYGQRPQPWKNPPKINQHTSTIKIMAHKP